MARGLLMNTEPHGITLTAPEGMNCIHTYPAILQTVLEIQPPARADLLRVREATAGEAAVARAIRSSRTISPGSPDCRSTRTTTSEETQYLAIRRAPVRVRAALLPRRESERYTRLLIRTHSRKRRPIFNAIFTGIDLCIADPAKAAKAQGHRMQKTTIHTVGL